MKKLSVSIISLLIVSCIGLNLQAVQDDNDSYFANQIKSINEEIDELTLHRILNGEHYRGPKKYEQHIKNAAEII